MSGSDSGRIMICGLACSLPDAEDLAQFWARQLNRTESGEISGRQEQHTTVIDLLQKVVRRALLDAGINEDKKRTDLVILLDGSGSVPDAVIAPLDEELKVSRTVSFASMGTLPEIIGELRTGKRGTLVLAAVDIANVQDLFRKAHTVSLAAVYLQGESRPPACQPYGVIRGLAADKNSDPARLHEAVGIGPERVGLLEVFSDLGRNDATGAPFAELCALFAADTPRLQGQLGIYGPAGKRPRAFSWLLALVRSSLCLHNKIIPPSGPGAAGISLPPELPFFLNQEARPWIHDPSWGGRLGAICSAQATEGYCLVEEYVSDAATAGIRPRPYLIELESDSELIVLAGDGFEDLAAGLEALLASLDKGIDERIDLKDLAAATVRELVPDSRWRLAIVCRSPEQLQEYLQLAHRRLSEGNSVFDDLEDIYCTVETGPPGKIACVFPGQGFPGLLGPYADHLYTLCQRFPEVREVFDLVERRDAHPRDPDLTSHIFFPPVSLPDEERRRLRQRLAAPRLADFKHMKSPRERDLSSFGVSVANRLSWILLRQLGLKADMVFGQSLGELSALCAAGSLDFSRVIASHWEIQYDSEELAAGRGRLALASADAERLAPMLEQYRDVTIAVHVSPSFQILGGEGTQLDEVVNKLRRDGIWTQFLPYPAIHTPRFSSLRKLFEPFLKSIETHPYEVPVYSGMVCGPYPRTREEMLMSMVDNLDHPLYLWQTTRKMYEDGARIFLQVGGGATMHAQAKTNIGRDDVIPLSLDVDYRTAILQLNHLCAALFCNGIDLNLDYLYSHRNARPLEIGGGIQPQKKIGLTEPGMPFVGRTVHYVENREIVIERLLDLAEDHFLAHHLFINAPGIKPVNARAPVMPLTVSMELMAETAACLAPGYGLLGFEDIKTNRWIGLDDSDTLMLQTSAQIQHVDPETGNLWIAVAVYLPEHERPAVEAVLRFGMQYGVTVDLQFPEPVNLRPYPVSAAEVYREQRLFHGPVFQCISGEVTLGDRSVFGELTVLPKDTMFTSQPDPEMLTDPVLLDGVGQLVGLWAIDKGVYVFPIIVKQVEFYCPTPPVGARVPVRIEIREFSSKFLYADVEIQDGSGHVWMRIRGWGDWVFRWTEKIYNFRRFPTRYCTSHTLELGLPAGIQCSARMVAKSELRDMELAFMARYYLHTSEMARFRELEKNPERQLLWLLGRIAAKDAVRCLLADDEEMLHPAAFAIENDGLGKPVVKRLPVDSPIPQVSIAHCRDHAVAMAAGYRVAVDLEEVKKRDPGFLKSFTSEDERELLREVAPEPDPEWLTRLWCAKEVAGKMLGTGVDGAPQKFKAVEVSDDGTVLIRRDKNRIVPVKSFRLDDFIVAFAAGDETGRRNELEADRHQGRKT